MDREQTWKLKRTAQCAKCPWRVEIDPREIPNGYSEEKHRALACTIAEPGVGSLRHQGAAMACHETHDAHCIGWLVHQLGPGNNIGLRMRMMTCANANKIRTRGEQHQRFEDTLPA
jgi:hypothetical protein